MLTRLIGQVEEQDNNEREPKKVNDTHTDVST
jgi:hypothetical protein